MSAEVPPVLVVGEALIDIVLRADGTQTSHVGGSPLNVAVGVARLGLDVWFQTAVGADPRGEQILAHLSANGVAFSEADSVVEHPTGVARALLGPDGSAAYDFEISWAPRRLAVGAAGALHVGSISALLEPGAGAVLELLSAVPAGVLVTFDPNIRPSITPDMTDVRARVERLVSRADLVKASDEDIDALYPDSSRAQVAERWQALGARVVVITRGSLGCSGWVGGRRVDVSAPRAVVADTIGAGDSFMAGLIAGMQQLPLTRDRAHFARPGVLEALLRFAVSCAAVTVARPGADPPRRDEVGWTWQAHSE